MNEYDWKEILDWDLGQIQDLRSTAFFYIREGHYKLAQTFCEGLVALEPNNSYDLHTLGALYLELNRPQKALHYLNKAYLQEPLNNLLQINRIKAFLSLDKKAEAQVLMQSFLHACKDKRLLNDVEALQMAYQL